MKQGSEEWHAMRLKHIGASDAPVIMGHSPWRKPIDLWREKVGLSVNRKMTGPMMYGKQEEGNALEWFNNNYPLPTKYEVAPFFEPCVKFHSSIYYIMASLDGYCFHWQEALEIKCPGKKDHELASKNQVPKKYIAQLQHQIEVCNLDFIWYCSYSPTSQFMFKVARDQPFIDEMLDKEAEFWYCVENFKEPT